VGTEPARVLVTGADGKIGRVVVESLVGRGIAVTGLSREWAGPSPADRAITGDATDEADVARALEDVDAVVHLAAIAHRDLAPPYDVYRTNTDATFNVLAQAGARGITRAVIASSINAFGVPMNRKPMRPAYFPIDEEIPTALDDWYSLSKRSDELTAEMAASRWDMTIVALRFPFVGTTEQVRRHARAATDQQIREGWSYLDLRDAAGAILASLTAPLTGAHVVALSAPDTFRPEATRDLLARYAPEVPLRCPVPGRTALIDTTRAQRLLGFTARHRLDDEAATVEHDRPLPALTASGEEGTA
jgi:nucleoside-diphosphate-sugar epimerase